MRPRWYPVLAKKIHGLLLQNFITLTSRYDLSKNLELLNACFKAFAGLLDIRRIWYPVFPFRTGGFAGYMANLISSSFLTKEHWDNKLFHKPHFTSLLLENSRLLSGSLWISGQFTSGPSLTKSHGPLSQYYITLHPPWLFKKSSCSDGCLLGGFCRISGKFNIRSISY